MKTHTNEGSNKGIITQRNARTKRFKLLHTRARSGAHNSRKSDMWKVILLHNHPTAISARTRNAKMSIQISSSACPDHQVYWQCRPCNFHCNDLLTGRVCIAQCIPGCACERDYYWNGTTCVPENQCHTSGKFKTSEISVCSSLKCTHEVVSLNTCCWGKLCDLEGL